MVATKCDCSDHYCPQDVVNKTCILQPGGGCFAFLDTELDLQYGCFEPEEYKLQCSNESIVIECCRNMDYCARQYSWVKSMASDFYEQSWRNINIILILMAISIVLFCLFHMANYFKLSDWPKSSRVNQPERVNRFTAETQM